MTFPRRCRPRDRLLDALYLILLVPTLTLQLFHPFVAPRLGLPMTAPRPLPRVAQSTLNLHPPRHLLPHDMKMRSPPFSLLLPLSPCPARPPSSNLKRIF